MSSPATTDRLDVWRDLIRDNFVALDIHADRDRTFAGSVRTSDLGHLTVASVESGTQGCSRTPGLARRDSDVYLQVGLIARGAATVAQDGREAVLRPGDFAVYETDRPFFWGLQGDWELLVFTWPRASIALDAGASQLLTARALSGGDGLGAIVGRMLRDLVTSPPELSAAGGASGSAPPRPRGPRTTCCAASTPTSWSAWPTRTCARRASPPRTSSPPATCTACSPTAAARSRSRSSACAWSAAAASCSTRAARSPTSPGAGGSPTWRPSAGPSAGRTGCRRASGGSAAHRCRESPTREGWRPLASRACHRRSSTCAGPHGCRSSVRCSWSACWPRRPGTGPAPADPSRSG